MNELNDVSTIVFVFYSILYSSQFFIDNHAKTMFRVFLGKFFTTIASVVLKIDTFVASYEEKGFYTISKMVFTYTVYNFYKREGLFYS